jgi:hypothetical protein
MLATAGHDKMVVIWRLIVSTLLFAETKLMVAFDSAKRGGRLGYRACSSVEGSSRIGRGARLVS